jgi:hypothetical protein
MDKNKDNLLDAMLDKRQKEPKARKVPGNLADILFKRRKDQENDYQKLLDAEK